MATPACCIKITVYSRQKDSPLAVFFAFISGKSFERIATVALLCHPEPWITPLVDCYISAKDLRVGAFFLLWLAEVHLCESSNLR